MSGVTVTIAGPEGAVLETVATEAVTAEQLDTGCRFSTEFIAEVEQRPVYTFSFVPGPLPATGPYFDGVGQIGQIRVAHEELEAAGFEVTFEAPPSFVVP
jgi:hypothetical protein